MYLKVPIDVAVSLLCIHPSILCICHTQSYSLDLGKMGMFIRKENTKQIYQYLFSKGVVVVKKDYNLAKNPDIPVSNLEVIKTLKSLVSRGLVKEEFNWQVYYFFLNEEGIVFLRSYLNIPEGVVPETVAKAAMPAREPKADSAAGGKRFSGPKTASSGPFKPSFAHKE